MHWKLESTHAANKQQKVTIVRARLFAHSIKLIMTFKGKSIGRNRKVKGVKTFGREQKSESERDKSEYWLVSHQPVAKGVPREGCFVTCGAVSGRIIEYRVDKGSIRYVARVRVTVQSVMLGQLYEYESFRMTHRRGESNCRLYGRNQDDQPLPRLPVTGCVVA